MNEETVCKIVETGKRTSASIIAFGLIIAAALLEIYGKDAMWVWIFAGLAALWAMTI